VETSSGLGRACPAGIEGRGSAKKRKEGGHATAMVVRHVRNLGACDTPMRVVG
jgi:hypothetical protein